MSYRILVIDDSPTIQKIFKISLSRYAVEVYSTNSFAQALHEGGERRADLLVVDANLPAVKGARDLQRLQEAHGDSPVLLLVGSHEPFDETGMRAAGYHYFLRKPFEPQDIHRVVTMIIGEDLPTRGGSSVAAGDRVPPPPPRGVGIPLSDVGVTEVDPFLASPPPPTPPPPPLSPQFLVDETRRAQRAFSEPVSPGADIGFSSPSDDLAETAILPHPVPSSDWQVTPPVADDYAPVGASSAISDRVAQETIDELRKQVDDFLTTEAPVLVRKTVEKYCEANFSRLAKEIITSELRRLAEEKSRLLSN